MKKLLIVDDQSAVRELVSVTLETGPCQVLMAENGEQALELAKDQLPDVMLLDIMMPNGPDGLDVCRQLKGDEATRDIYIIMLTVKGLEEDIQAGYEAGADDYFVKPYSPLELTQKVDSVLDKLHQP